MPDLTHLRSGWFQLWNRSAISGDESNHSYSPNSPDKLHVGEIAIVLGTTGEDDWMVRVLSPRGIVGWITRGNLLLVVAREDV
jgi:hypothetical protein